MFFWIAIQDKTQVSPDHSGWMTLREALASGRKAVTEGRRVIELREPSGRVWNEKELAERMASEA
ncbi:hypothetical protein [Bradyrhizobium murdochi]|uniref:hypothetical protein n=1 Tax=Bradyrhizobium murdochi TaxID=1038859 RepID=UPI00041CC796|nr:hypothetical protein [Bradyrhizobium murdochi]